MTLITNPNAKYETSIFNGPPAHYIKYIPTKIGEELESICGIPMHESMKEEYFKADDFEIKQVDIKWMRNKNLYISESEFERVINLFEKVIVSWPEVKVSRDRTLEKVIKVDSTLAKLAKPTLKLIYDVSNF